MSTWVGKLAMLINSGYISNVAVGQYPIYRMTEEFVQLLEQS